MRWGGKYEIIIKNQEYFNELFYVQRLPVNEIADKLDIPQEYVCTWINRHNMVRPKLQFTCKKYKRKKRESVTVKPENVTEDMVKVTDKYCDTCKYAPRKEQPVSKYGCNYYLITKISRGCPVGWCNKKERRSKGGKIKSRII